MESKEITAKEQEVLQGRAIARGIAEANAQKEKNAVKATKRMETMLRNAANKVFNTNY